MFLTCSTFTISVIFIYLSGDKLTQNRQEGIIAGLGKGEVGRELRGGEIFAWAGGGEGLLFADGEEGDVGEGDGGGGGIDFCGEAGVEED